MRYVIYLLTILFCYKRMKSGSYRLLERLNEKFSPDIINDVIHDRSVKMSNKVKHQFFVNSS